MDPAPSRPAANEIDYVRTKLIQQLQDKIIGIKNTPEHNIECEFGDFCNHVTQNLAQSTTSHSSTIRRYNSFRDTLDLVSSWTSLTQQHNFETTYSLPCDPASSVNAYCYRNVGDDEFVSIPDIRSIPQAYQHHGLVAVLITRLETQSELCVPIGTDHVRLGTLNLESQELNHYQTDDIQHVKNVAFLVSQYWKSLNSADDIWWLSQLSRLHLATHELKDFKSRLDEKQRADLDRILLPIFPASHYHPNQQLTWQVLLDFLRSEHIRVSASTAFDSIWTVSGVDPNMPISPRYLSSLKLVFQSILDNTKHSIYHKNRIEIKCIVYNNRRPLLQITYRSMVSYLDSESIAILLDRFRVPQLSADGWHFGLFLIGVHVRQLGGTVEIDPTCLQEYDYGPFAYRVRIPLEE